MTRFRLTVNLASPLITGGGYLTLDALLAALLFEEGGDLERAHSEIPLKNTFGLWHGSAALFEAVERGRHAFVANLRAMHDLELELIAKNKQGKTHTKIGLARRREFGAVMNSYRCISTPAMTWYGEGDCDQIRSLVSRVSFIGKRRASGYGQVSSFEIEEAELDGILGYAKEPLRPIPEHLFRGDRSSLRADTAWRPAYWHPDNRAVCFVPELGV